MTRITRRTAIRAIAGGGALIALGAAGDYVARHLFGSSSHGGPSSTAPAHSGGDMTAGMMMGDVTELDMSTYTDLFSRHTELRRTVHEIPGGVRTITEASSPDLVARLQEHVSSMYGHLAQGHEVTCMSRSLPTLFRNARGYRRHLTLTASGVAVTETSTDPRLTSAIREHALEVTGFVREGMPGMMRSMMGG